MTRYVGIFQLCGLTEQPVTLVYPQREALTDRLDMLHSRGHRGDRCRSCLDCTRHCSAATSRPVRPGWKATWHQRKEHTNVH